MATSKYEPLTPAQVDRIKQSMVGMSTDELRLMYVDARDAADETSSDDDLWRYLAEANLYRNAWKSALVGEHKQALHTAHLPSCPGCIHENEIHTPDDCPFCLSEGGLTITSVK